MVFLLDEPGTLVEVEGAPCASQASSSCASEPDWPAQVPTLELPDDYWEDSAMELQEPEPAFEEQPADERVDADRGASGGVGAAAAEGVQPRLSEQGTRPQLSGSSTGPLRPTRSTTRDQEDTLLRLLAEAYGQMMLARSGRQGGALTEEELEGWLRQLRELALSGDGDTVLALFSALRAQHSWARLRDVYSALVRLRESHSLGDSKRSLS